MSRNELKTVLYISAAVAVGVLGLLVWALDGMQIGPQTVRRIPTAITATSFFWVVFARWGWKWWPLSLLFKIPYVGGTWVGHLESEWQKGATTQLSSVPIAFIIKQTLFSLVIRSFTINREGLSDVAKLVVREEIGITYVSYVYALREEFRAGQGTQQGAAELRFIEEQIPELRGQYWTNMNTSGRLLLRRCSKHTVRSFNDACAPRC